MAKVDGLSELINRKYKTETDFARTLGWPRQRLNKITTGKKEPDLWEVAEMASGLDVTLEALAGIFLNNKSPNGQQNRTA